MKYLELNFSSRISSHKSIYKILLGLLVLTYLLPLKFNAIIIALLFLNWLIDGGLKEKFNTILTNKLIILYISFYALLLIRSLFSENFTEAFNNLETKLSFALIPIIIGTSEKLNRKVFLNILNLFVIGNIVAILFCYVNASYQYFINDLEKAFTIYHFHHVLQINRTYFSLAIAISICIMLYHFYYSTIKSERIKIIAIALFLIISLIKLASRTPTISTLLVINIFVLLLLLKKFSLVKSSLMIVSFNVVLSAIGLFFMSDHVLSKYSRSSSDIRMEIWNNSIELAKSNFLLGHSLADYQDKQIDIYKKKKNEKLIELKLNAHNQFLETMLYSGIVGLLLLLLIIFLPLYYSIKEKEINIILFTILISICFMTESYLENQRGIVIFTFFNSFFAFNLLSKSSLCINKTEIENANK